jgi:biotin synthase
MQTPRDPWLTRAEALMALPFFDLLYEAHRVHRAHHEVLDVQKCALLSIKTGGCPEDCAYCPQSAHYDTGLKREALMPLAEVREAARTAAANGAARFCMGAAWRQPKDGPEFDRVLDMVRAVKAEGLEACLTLGMLTPEQAVRLREAGLDAYNHNLDTSREHYDQIISTRTYDERLTTLRNVRQAGITICSGGIIGMGESTRDRCALLAELAALEPQPESVPINLLIPVEGTPLAASAPVDPLDLVRMVCVARILMPKSRVRLSAGRTALSREAQVMCFFAGANSIFVGDTLLTCLNPPPDADAALLASLGASPGPGATAQ